jgi:hypothetical protein
MASQMLDGDQAVTIEAQRMALAPLVFDLIGDPAGFEPATSD